MQITQTNSDGLKRDFTIVVEAAEIDSKVTERLTSVGAEIRLPGFRPGKVPLPILRKRFGKSVLGEVLEQTVNELSQKALEDNNLRPAQQPKIEITSFDEGKDLEFKLEVEIMPDFKPMDFTKLKLEKPVAEVDESRVDEALKEIAAQQKNFVKVARNRKAKEGDALLIDFVGKIDGVPFEGGSAEGHQLELGSNTFIPGFEDQLIGAKGGDEVAVKVTFPENYGAEHLAGKEAVFEVKVHEVQEAADVEINDEFAQKLGLENLEALKNAIRSQIEQQYAQLSRQALKRNMLDAMAEAHDFEVPPGLKQSEFDSIWEQFQRELEQNGQKLEDQEQSEEELREEYMNIAERRVRLGLLLAEVGRLNNIEVTQEEVNQAMIAQARNFPGQEKLIFEMFQKRPELQAQLRAPIFEDKVIDFIAELATITEKKVSIDDLLRDPDEETEDKPKKKAAKKSSAKKASDDAGEEPKKAPAKKAAKKADDKK